MNFPVGQTPEGNVLVTCKITHESGYSEESSLNAPPDTGGKKGPTQAIGSTITRLSRYLALSMTGLATKNQDIETPPEPEPVITISDKQEIELTDLIEAKGRTIEAFCKWAKIGKLSDLCDEAFEPWMKKLGDIK